MRKGTSQTTEPTLNQLANKYHKADRETSLRKQSLPTSVITRIEYVNKS